MKKSLLFILAIILLNINSNAQCTGCTTSVTGLSTIPYFVTAGQKLCISSTGTITGNIAVYGGTLCNQGTINTSKVLIYNGGKFDNYGLGDIDSLQVQDANSIYNNYGTGVNVRFATITNAISNNYSTITADYTGDSTGAVVNNNGNMTINIDFYNGSNGTFNNNNYLKITGSFYNTTTGVMYTKCKVNVGANFYNQGLLKGPTTNCGGFNITGNSANTGTVGIAGQKIDICDAGSPSSFDANTGNITNATFCTCTNSCVSTIGIKENNSTSISKAVFPNPCLNKCVTEYNETISSVTLFNELGQIVKASVSISENKVEVNSSNLKSGIYFIEATSVSGKTNRQKFIVE